jgi:HEAT repeat protein
MSRISPLSLITSPLFWGALILIAWAGMALGHGSNYKAPPEPIPFMPADAAASGDPITLTGPKSPPSASAAAATSAGSTDDMSHWTYWWYFNKDELLPLRELLQASTTSSGEGAKLTVLPRPSGTVLGEQILPALFEAILEDRTGTVSATSFIALGRIGAPQEDLILSTIMAGVADRDPISRESALLSLGIQGDLGAIEILLAALANSKEIRKQVNGKFNGRARAFAAYGLSLIASRAQNDDVRRMILLSMLHHFENPKEDQDVRVALAIGLGKMQLPFKDPRRSLEVPNEDKDSDVGVRYRDDLLERLWLLLDEEDDRVVAGHLPVAIASLAADSPAPMAEAVVKGLLERLDGKVYRHELSGLVIALGRMGTAWGRPMDSLVRDRLYSLARESKDHHARHMALMALAEACNRGDGARPPKTTTDELEAFLVERYLKGRKSDRPWVALAAGAHGARMHATGLSVGDDLAIEMRITLNESNGVDEVSTAALACGLMRDPKAGELLEKVLDRSGNASVRGFTGLALGLVNQRSAKAKMEILVDHFRYQPVALENISLGLGLMDRTATTALLRDRLSKASSNATVSALASSLGQLGDSASIQMLTGIVRDRSRPAPVRVAAAGALGLIGERGNLPWRHFLSNGVNYSARTDTMFDAAGNGVLNFL